MALEPKAQLEKLKHLAQHWGRGRDTAPSQFAPPSTWQNADELTLLQDKRMEVARALATKETK